MCVSYSKYVKLEVAEVKESALAADVNRDDRESDCAVRRMSGAGMHILVRIWKRQCRFRAEVSTL